MKIFCLLSNASNGCIPLENFANIKDEEIEKHVITLYQTQNILKSFINKNYPKNKLIPHGLKDHNSSTYIGKNFIKYLLLVRRLQPDFVHIMKSGKIVESGDKNIAKKIEDEGYGNM